MSKKKNLDTDNYLEIADLISQKMIANSQNKADNYSDICDYYWDEAIKNFNNKKWKEVKKLTDNIKDKKMNIDSEFETDAMTLHAIALLSENIYYHKEKINIAVEELEKANDIEKNSEWTLRCLVMSYFMIENILKGCFIWAKYNLDFNSNMPFYKDSCITYTKTFSVRGKYFYEYAYKKILNEVETNEKIFDDMYELHRQYPSSCDYLEMLSFVGASLQQYSRITSLYEDYFKIRTIKNTNYNNYIFMLCEYINVLSNSHDKKMIEKMVEVLNKDYQTVECNIDSDVIKKSYIECKMNAYNELNEYKKTIEFSNKIPRKYISNRVLYLRSMAINYIGNSKEALLLAKSALYLNADYMELINIGEIYISLMEFDKACEVLKLSINYILTDKGENNIEITPSLYPNKKTFLSKAFSLLMQSLLYQEKYIEYQAMYNQMENIIPDIDKKRDMALNKLIAEKLIGKEKELQTQMDIIKQELYKKQQKIDKYSKKYSQWYNLLIQNQILDANTNITDDIWESDFENNLNFVVDNIIKEYAKTISDKYIKRIQNEFPNMDKVNKKLLATADRLYDVFTQQDIIDFAPVIIEYGRVFEALVWKYLNNNSIYDKYIEKNLPKRYMKTLGNAKRVIRDAKETPINVYYHVVERITQNRNECAHMAKDRVPNAKEMYDIVWKSDFIKFLIEN